MPSQLGALELAPRGHPGKRRFAGLCRDRYHPAAHFSDPAVYRRALERHPLGRMTTPQDVADVVAFLCLDDARFVTGQNINVSGGFVV